jgi:protein-tyrosine kinase
MFDAADSGLSNLLISDTSNPTAYLLSSKIPNLRILPTGPIPPNPAELIGSRRMAEIMTELKSLADLVVVDSPALLAVADATVAVTLCDAVVLVVRPDRCKRPSLLRAVEMLQSAGARIAGLVVNSFGKTDNGYYRELYFHAGYYPAKPGKRNAHQGASVGSPRKAADR